MRTCNWGTRKVYDLLWLYNEFASSLGFVKSVSKKSKPNSASTWKGEAGSSQDQSGLHSKHQTSQDYIVKPCPFFLKKKKWSQHFSDIKALKCLCPVQSIKSPIIPLTLVFAEVECPPLCWPCLFPVLHTTTCPSLKAHWHELCREYWSPATGSGTLRPRYQFLPSPFLLYVLAFLHQNKFLMFSGPILSLCCFLFYLNVFMSQNFQLTV